jgi:K+-transporting ATPase c subunit
LQHFLYLQELRTFAPLQIQNVREGAQLFSQRMNKYLPPNSMTIREMLAIFCENVVNVLPIFVTP